MARVYVSSTFLDLQAERRAVADAARQLGHQVVAMEDYVAGDERPVARCVEDVRGCDVYVGVLGWRYGFRPPGSDVSIVELEYRAATEAGRKRLIFLSPEADEWRGPHDSDRTAITRLRDRLRQEHVVSEFAGPADLRAEVAIALSRVVGTERPVPRILPYLCDRQPQYAALSEALAAASFPGGRRPVVALAHGTADQALDGLLDVLQEEELPRILGRPPEEIRFRWPMAPPWEPRLIRALGDATCGEPEADADRVRAVLAARPDAVLLTATLDGATLSAGWSEGVEALGRLAASWPVRSPRRSILVLLSLVLPEPPSWFGALMRRGDPVRDGLRRLEGADTVSVLPRLPDVRRLDAIEWQSRPNVRKWCPDVDLTPRIEEAFSSQPSMPMRRAAQTLRELLESARRSAS